MLLPVVSLKQIGSNYFPAFKLPPTAYRIKSKFLAGPPRPPHWFLATLPAFLYYHPSPQVTPNSGNELTVFPKNPTEFPNSMFLLWCSLFTCSTLPLPSLAFLLMFQDKTMSVYSFKSNYSNDLSVPRSARSYPETCNRQSLPSRNIRVVKPAWKADFMITPDDKCHGPCPYLGQPSPVLSGRLGDLLVYVLLGIVGHPLACVSLK